MKFSQTTILALLATSAFVSAAPSPVVSSDVLVTREQNDEIMSILEEIRSLKTKRELTDDEHLAELAKREESLLVQLVSALSSSGLLTDVWKVLANDEDLRTDIVNISKGILKVVIADAPNLLKDLWNSGLFEVLYKDVVNDEELRSVLFKVAKKLFVDAGTLLTLFKDGSNSDSSATKSSDASATAVYVTFSGAPTTTSASSTTSISLLDKRENLSHLQERDVSSLVTTIYSAIKDSGIIQSLLNRVLANPQQAINFLVTILKESLSIGKELFAWAKLNGLLDKALDYLGSNGGTYGAIIARLLGGSSSSSGSTGTVTTAAENPAVTVNADANAVTTTTYTTTTALVNANTLRKVKRAYY